MGPTASDTTGSYSLSNHCVQTHCLQNPGFLLQMAAGSGMWQNLPIMNFLLWSQVAGVDHVTSAWSALAPLPCTPPTSLHAFSAAHTPGKDLGLKGCRHFPPCFTICVG